MPFTRILVVEDYEPFRQLICLSLQQRAEFQVSQATDGLEAVQKATELQPDLILIDIGLPKLNGIEAAIRMRRLAPKAKLLFVSQESNSEVVRETFRVGGRGYVHKPAVLTDLLPAIHAVLAGERFVSSDLEFSVDMEGQRRHEVHFYADDEGLMKRASRFIADAMEVADAAIVLATERHREGLVQSLQADGLDVDRAIEHGTYIAVDAADTLSKIMVNGAPDPVRFSEGLQGLMEAAGKIAQTEQPRVALFGECVGLLCAEGNTSAALGLEKIANDLMKTHSVDILCAYPVHDQKDDDVLKTICAEHTTIYWR